MNAYFFAPTTTVYTENPFSESLFRCLFSATSASIIFHLPDPHLPPKGIRHFEDILITDRIPGHQKMSLLWTPSASATYKTGQRRSSDIWTRLSSLLRRITLFPSVSGSDSTSKSWLPYFLTVRACGAPRVQSIRFPGHPQHKPDQSCASEDSGCPDRDSFSPDRQDSGLRLCNLPGFHVRLWRTDFIKLPGLPVESPSDRRRVRPQSFRLRLLQSFPQTPEIKLWTHCHPRIRSAASARSR